MFASTDAPMPTAFFRTELLRCLGTHATPQRSTTVSRKTPSHRKTPIAYEPHDSGRAIP